MDGQAAIAQGSDCLAEARSVVELLKAASSRIDESRELPPDVLAALHDAGLFRILLPTSVGGREIDLVSLSEVTRIVAAADASAAWCIGQGGGCAMTAAYLASEPRQRLFGAKDAVLAWGAGVQGTAVEVPGGYRVTGTWSFASGSRHATILGAHCKVVGPNGEARLRPDGRPADCTALFARAKANIQDIWQVVGLKGTGSDTYEVRDLFVPASDTADREGWGESQVPGTLFRFPQIMAYAAAFGGVMLGISRGMLDDVKALAMIKTGRGASSSMRESPVFQTDLARLEGRWRAARALHLNAFREVWEAVDAGGALTLEHRVNTRLAATHAINEGCQIAVDAYRAAGQNAIFENAPFEKRVRDALSAAQQVQGRPSHFTTVGRHLLGLEPDSMMFL